MFFYFFFYILFLGNDFFYLFMDKNHFIVSLYYIKELTFYYSAQS